MNWKNNLTSIKYQTNANLCKFFVKSFAIGNKNSYFEPMDFKNKENQLYICYTNINNGIADICKHRYYKYLNSLNNINDTNY